MSLSYLLFFSNYVLSTWSLTTWPRTWPSASISLRPERLRLRNAAPAPYIATCEEYLYLFLLIVKFGRNFFLNCKLQSGVKSLETDGSWLKHANSMLLWYLFIISLPLILTFVILEACLLSLICFSEVFRHLMWKIPQYEIFYIILTPAFAGSAPEWGQSWSFPRGDREWSPAWTPAMIALQLEKIVKEHQQYCNTEEIVKRVCKWAGESIKGL